MYKFGLPMKGPIGPSYDADPDDVLVAKESLRRTGYYRLPDFGLTDAAGNDLFDSIRSFQSDHGLTVDGVMRPSGQTAHSVARHLVKTPADQDPTKMCSSRRCHIDPRGKLNPNSRYEGFGPPEISETPDETDCYNLHYNIDVPTCKALGNRRGKRAAARCYASANARYSACLAGTPIDKLPPLDTWNN